MYKILLTFLIILMAPAVIAVPALQLYIPDATWNAATQTWVVSSSDFELWVIAADTDTKPIYDLTLVAAIADTDTPVDGGLSINGSPVMASGYEYGTPPSWGTNAGSYPPHGIYPTFYHEMTISSLVNTAPEIVYDMQPGMTGSTFGMIFKYQISTTYDWIHFDSYGFLQEPDGHFKFVPNSHDAERVVPEPTTMILMGLGLAGVALRNKFRK